MAVTEKTVYSAAGDIFSLDSANAVLTKSDVDKMFRDAAVRTAWKLREYAEIMAGWHWEYPGQNKELGEKLIRHIEWQFENCDIGMGMKRGMYDFISTLNLPLKYGHTVYEPVWEYDKKYEQVVLRKWKPLPPDYDVFVWDKYRNITEYYQSFNPDNRIPYDEVIHVTNGGYDEAWVNPYGMSELRGVWRYYLMKDHAQKWWMDYLERKAVGPLVIKIPPGLSDEDRNAIQNILANLNTRLGFTLPGGTKDMPGAEVEQIQMSDATEIFKQLIAYCDKMITQACMLGELVLNASSSSGTGSRALGDVHEDMLLSVVSAYHAMKEPIINKLARQMCILNYGDELEKDLDGNAITPVFKFNKPRHKDITKLAQAYSQLIQVGVLSPAEDWIRESMDMPEYQRPVTSSDSGVEEGEKEQVEEETGVEARVAAAAPKRAVPPNLRFKENYGHLRGFYAKMTTRLRSRIYEWMDRVISRMSKQAEKTVKKADKAGELVEATAPGKDYNYSAINRLSIKQEEYDELLGILNNVAKDSANTGSRDITEGLDIPPVPPERALKFLKQQNILSRDDLAADVEKRVRQTLLSGLSNGKTIQQMRGDLEAIIDSVSTSKIEAIVRTNVMKAYNLGRDDAMKSSDIIVGYVIDAVLDERTSEICESLAGQFVAKDDPDYDKYLPPLHFNCRSVASPVTRYDDVDSLEPVDKTIQPEEGFGG